MNFRMRPLQSRYGAWASHQSEAVPERESLERRYEEAEAAYGYYAPLPGHWGGPPSSPRTRSSSGSTATTGCTTGFATGSYTALGWWRGSHLSNA